MTKILLINAKRKRWSARVEITKIHDKYGGLTLEITDQFEHEAPKHLATIVAHHHEARELIVKLLNVLLE